jgi:hypothetical protein
VRVSASSCDAPPPSRVARSAPPSLECKMKVYNIIEKRRQNCGRFGERGAQAARSVSGFGRPGGVGRRRRSHDVLLHQAAHCGRRGARAAAAREVGY